MALGFSIKSVISKGLGGLKIRLVTITFDNAYVAATGYVITPANCKLKKILSFGSINLPGYQVGVKTYNSDGSVNVIAYKGNTNSSDNESGLNTLVGIALVTGY